MMPFEWADYVLWALVALVAVALWFLFHSQVAPPPPPEEPKEHHKKEKKRKPKAGSYIQQSHRRGENRRKVISDGLVIESTPHDKEDVQVEEERPPIMELSPHPPTPDDKEIKRNLSKGFVTIVTKKPPRPTRPVTKDPVPLPASPPSSPKKSPMSVKPPSPVVVSKPLDHAAIAHKIRKEKENNARPPRIPGGGIVKQPAAKTRTGYQGLPPLAGGAASAWPSRAGASPEPSPAPSPKMAASPIITPRSGNSAWPTLHASRSPGASPGMRTKLRAEADTPPPAAAAEPTDDAEDTPAETTTTDGVEEEEAMTTQGQEVGEREAVVDATPAVEEAASERPGSDDFVEMGAAEDEQTTADDGAAAEAVEAEAEPPVADRDDPVADVEEEGEEAEAEPEAAAREVDFAEEVAEEPAVPEVDPREEEELNAEEVADRDGLANTEATNRMEVQSLAITHGEETGRLTVEQGWKQAMEDTKAQGEDLRQHCAELQRLTAALKDLDTAEPVERATIHDKEGRDWMTRKDEHRAGLGKLLTGEEQTARGELEHAWQEVINTSEAEADNLKKLLAELEALSSSIVNLVPLEATGRTGILDNEAEECQTLNQQKQFLALAYKCSRLAEQEYEARLLLEGRMEFRLKDIEQHSEALKEYCATLQRIIDRREDIHAQQDEGRSAVVAEEDAARGKLMEDIASEMTDMQDQQHTVRLQSTVHQEEADRQRVVEEEAQERAGVTSACESAMTELRQQEFTRGVDALVEDERVGRKGLEQEWDGTAEQLNGERAHLLQVAAQEADFLARVREWEQLEADVRAAASNVADVERSELFRRCDLQAEWFLSSASTQQQSSALAEMCAAFATGMTDLNQGEQAARDALMTEEASSWRGVEQEGETSRARGLEMEARRIQDIEMRLRQDLLALQTEEVVARDSVLQEERGGFRSSVAAQSEEARAILERERQFRRDLSALWYEEEDARRAILNEAARLNGEHERTSAEAAEKCNRLSLVAAQLRDLETGEVPAREAIQSGEGGEWVSAQQDHLVDAAMIGARDIQSESQLKFQDMEWHERVERNRQARAAAGGSPSPLQQRSPGLYPRSPPLSGSPPRMASPPLAERPGSPTGSDGSDGHLAAWADTKKRDRIVREESIERRQCEDREWADRCSLNQREWESRERYRAAERQRKYQEDSIQRTTRQHLRTHIQEVEGAENRERHDVEEREKKDRRQIQREEDEERWGARRAELAREDTEKRRVTQQLDLISREADERNALIRRSVDDRRNMERMFQRDSSSILSRERRERLNPASPPPRMETRYTPPPPAPAAAPGAPPPKAYLGLSLVDRYNPGTNGVELTVDNVRSGSPAEDGGLYANDRISRCNGYVVGKVEEFKRVAQHFSVGSPVALEVERDDQTGVTRNLQIQFFVGESPS